MSSAVSADSFTAELLSHQPVLKSCAVAKFRQLLTVALSEHTITIPRFENQLRKLVATITEPAGKRSEKALCTRKSYLIQSNLVTFFSFMRDIHLYSHIYSFLFCCSLFVLFYVFTVNIYFSSAFNYMALNSFAYITCCVVVIIVIEENSF